MSHSIGGLTKDDSSLIGFVVTCVFCQAIDIGDLRKWAEHVISEHPVGDIPEYIFELCYFEGWPKDLYRVIGFVSDSKVQQRDEHALYGIAARRGVQPFDWPLSVAAAEKALTGNPKLQTKFQEIFPFISIP